MAVILVQAQRLFRSQSFFWACTGFTISALLALVVLTPIFFILWNSFHTAVPGRGGQFVYFENWQEFGNWKTWDAITNSVILSLRHPLSVGIALVIAWLIARVRVPLSGFIELSFWLAYLSPTMSLVISWILLLDPTFGLLNIHFLNHFGLGSSIYSLYGITWVHFTSSTLPVMVILIIPLLRRTEAVLEEAARVCGASPVYALRRVLIPVLIPGLLTVLLASLIRGLESFQVELLLGTPVGIEVFSTRIFNLLEYEPPLWGSAMALSTFFLGLLFLLAIFYQRYTRSRQYATISGRGVSFQPTDIGKGRYIISAALVLLVFASVYLPFGVLILGSFMRLFGFFDVSNPFSTDHWVSVLTNPEFLNGIQASMTLGLGVAAVGVLMYSLIAYTLVRTPISEKLMITVLVWLPWAIPGILMGAAFLWIFLSFEIASYFYGTLAGLGLILIVQEMPIGVHLAKAAFIQIGPHLEEAGRVCGGTRIHIFRKIMIPLAIPTLVSVFVIVFMGAIRAVDSILLVAGSGVRPLSLLMLDYSMSARIEAASIVGVIMSLLALSVVILSRKFGLQLIGR